MEFRKLLISDSEKLEELIDVIENHLENAHFWLPINEESRKHFFDDAWTEFYGVFDGEHLIGASGLFYNIHEYGESLQHLEQEYSNVAEIGRAMVHPKYRGNNILYQINMKLLEVAKQRGVEYILSTIHPDNIPSQCSFKKIGFEKKCTYKKYDKYLRDIFLIKLS